MVLQVLNGEGRFRIKSKQKKFMLERAIIFQEIFPTSCGTSQTLNFNLLSSYFCSVSRFAMFLLLPEAFPIPCSGLKGSFDPRMQE